MEKLGPRVVVLEKDASFSTQSGPSNDSDIFQLNLKVGHEVSVFITEGHLILRVNNIDNYIPLPVSVEEVARKRTPSTRQLLNAQGSMITGKVFPVEIGDAVVKMLDEQFGYT